MCFKELTPLDICICNRWIHQTHHLPIFYHYHWNCHCCCYCYQKYFYQHHLNFIIIIIIIIIEIIIKIIICVFTIVNMIVIAVFVVVVIITVIITNCWSLSMVLLSLLAVKCSLLLSFILLSLSPKIFSLQYNICIVVVTFRSNRRNKQI